MKKIIILIGIVMILISGCVKDSNNLVQSELSEEEKIEEGMGLADPSAIYCHQLGYKLKSSQTQGFCVFPDGSECDTWAFYRGECGRKWSICTKLGYDMKNLTQYEGWDEGGICITKKKTQQFGNITSTKAELVEIGTVHSLMNMNLTR